MRNDAMTSHQRGAKRWQFSLRTFLIVALCLGATPLGVQQYRKWHSANLWANLEAARADRDRVQQLWNEANLQFKSNKDGSSRAQEQAARQQYFTARDKVAITWQQLVELYGVEGIIEMRIVDRNGEKCLIPYK
jgi:cell division protein FtsL